MGPYGGRTGDCQSPLPQGRGLKPEPHQRRGIEPQSPLPQGRGLKLKDGVPLKMMTARVAPPAGAWIETQYCHGRTIVTVRGVAPPAGAWIETRNGVRWPLITNPPVAPPPGAWIETTVAATTSKWPGNSVAPSAWAWIETGTRVCPVVLWLVAPPAGAWIETPLSSPYGTKSPLSPLPQGRGLKLASSETPHPIRPVPSCRPSSQGRGLKRSRRTCRA